MSRLRRQIRRDDDTSEDVQRLETAGNAVFSNRLKRATRFRSTSTSTSTSTFDHRLRTGGNAVRVAPSAPLGRRQAPTPRAPASADLVPATEPASRSAPAAYIALRSFPEGRPFLAEPNSFGANRGPAPDSASRPVCVVATPGRSYRSPPITPVCACGSATRVCRGDPCVSQLR